MNELSARAARIRASLTPMIEKAKREGLMFQHSGRIYGDVRFTPDKLELENAAGRFIWEPVNWRLEPMTEAEATTAMLDDMNELNQ